MRVHVAWPLLLTLAVVALLGIVMYQRSWIPGYQEAEPLLPIVAEFGRELADLNEDGAVTVAELEQLILEERFAPIQTYGIVFSADPDFILSIRVNERFSFDIQRDGHPRWSKKP
ncbi:MAG: hypothetical protein ACJAQT_004893 [Akkermansiaceae bacterium]|jgi:hypothetical protein